MNPKLIIACCLVSMLTITGCASMTDTQKRMTTGAAIGGVGVGLVTGEWGWAAAGAAAGAAGGYLYDKSKKNEQKAYSQGYKDGQAKQTK